MHKRQFFVKDIKKHNTDVKNLDEINEVNLLVHYFII